MLHDLLDNEGGQVKLIYADGTGDKATIDQLLIRDESVAALITVGEANEPFFCTLDKDSSSEQSLDCYRDPDAVDHLHEDNAISTSPQQPDRRVVEITDEEGT
jgi:hypothetical protein